MEGITNEIIKRQFYGIYFGLGIEKKAIKEHVYMYKHTFGKIKLYCLRGVTIEGKGMFWCQTCGNHLSFCVSMYSSVVSQI